jgi:hypothetical protein
MAKPPYLDAITSVCERSVALCDTLGRPDMPADELRRYLAEVDPLIEKLTWFRDTLPEPLRALGGADALAPFIARLETIALNAQVLLTIETGA